MDAPSQEGDGLGRYFPTTYLSLLTWLGTVTLLSHLQALGHLYVAPLGLKMWPERSPKGSCLATASHPDLLSEVGPQSSRMGALPGSPSSWASFRDKLEGPPSVSRWPCVLWSSVEPSWR